MTQKPLASGSITVPRILHVDDSEDMREIVLLSLETIGGLEVKQASSGAEALEMALPYVPDLFLLDVMMPEMTGPELMKNLRRLPEFATTPVVFLTAKAQVEELAELNSLGALAVMTKPFDPMHLAEEVVELWQGHLRDLGAGAPKAS